MQIAQYKFGGALINSTGKQLFQSSSLLNSTAQVQKKKKTTLPVKLN